jgi:hypothetical protein
MLVEMKPQGFAVYVDGERLAEYETQAEALAAMSALERYAAITQTEAVAVSNGADPVDIITAYE